MKVPGLPRERGRGGAGKEEGCWCLGAWCPRAALAAGVAGQAGRPGFGPGGLPRCCCRPGEFPGLTKGL